MNQQIEFEVIKKVHERGEFHEKKVLSNINLYFIHDKHFVRMWNKQKQGKTGGFCKTNDICIK